jgi:molecular chaperone HscB
MQLADDDFRLFALPRRFTLDRDALDVQWRRLQAEVHPDRFAAEGAAAQRVAMQWALRVNEAYRRLKAPLQRAAYLCELAGAAIDAERNTAMPAQFLVQQMAWREALDDAASAGAVQALEADVARDERERFGRIARLLDADPPRAEEAAQDVRALMFVERFRRDIEARLDALEAVR